MHSNQGINMTQGFLLHELRVTGPTVPDAIVGFSEGLNIISGASNTGKSYIFQCLDYMFGGNKAPKKIDESRHYAYCHLTISNKEGKVFTLKSDLRGGAVQLFVGGYSGTLTSSPISILSRQHKEDNQDSVSQFFLGLCNLQNKKLKKTEKGQKRNLTFRDLVRLSLVDEEEILTSGSPILGNNPYDKTGQISAFKLLLTGMDDSEIVEKLGTKEIANRKGKLEMLNSLIIDLRSEINQAGGIQLDQTQLNRISNSEQEIRQQLREADQINRELANTRATIEDDRYVDVTQHAELSNVLERSQILASQYESDASRLTSTIEACQLFEAEKGQEKACPLCHTQIQQPQNQTDLDAILTSCQQELVKIQLLQNELEASQIALKNEMNAKLIAIEDAEIRINAINQEIQSRVNNIVSDNLTQLQALQTTREAIQLQQMRLSRMEALETSKREIESSIRGRSGKIEKESLSSIIEPLNRQMLTVLQQCHYPNITTVAFSDDKLDFIISGRDRELTGKGYRAITYATFIVGLQLHILPRPYGMCTPVLDSPLVTYRKPETDGEDIPIDLAMNFYRYLATSTLPQIVVLENEEPPSDITDNINHIVFTGSISNGRYGFFPKET